MRGSLHLYFYPLRRGRKLHKMDHGWCRQGERRPFGREEFGNQTDLDQRPALSIEGDET